MLMLVIWIVVMLISVAFVLAALRKAGDADEALERIMASQSIEACVPATDIEDLCILSGAEGWTVPAREREAS